MEENKLLKKPFKQTFRITDRKQNIIEIPFIIENITAVVFLDSEINVKDEYTRKHESALTFFQRKNKQPPFFSNFYPIYNKERKHPKPL